MKDTPSSGLWKGLGPWTECHHLQPVERLSVEAEPRRVSILGATGSIGTSTFDLLDRNPGAYDVVALTANHNVEALAELA